ncbi:MAG: F0F1 ATP synthase subunit B [Propionibacteriaceae bacterium]|nr:F0F1 ATP synthase subunit B [Propionibacteriaceae bacterium]
MSDLLGPLWPNHLAEVIAGFVFLLLLWGIFAKWVSPMFEKMYQERSSQIEGGIMRAQKAEAEAADAKQQYETQLASARQDAAKVREDARAVAVAQAKQVHDDAVAEAARIVAQGRSQVDAERAAARDELRGEIGDLATTLAGRIVGDNLRDDKKAATVIDQFLAELATMDARGVTA